MGDEGGGSLISPDGVAPSPFGTVSASDISPSTMKSRTRFLLAPAHPGSPGERAIIRLCVCVLPVVALVVNALHRESKKGATLTMAITLSILGGFAKFFYFCKEQ